MHYKNVLYPFAVKSHARSCPHQSNRMIQNEKKFNNYNIRHLTDNHRIGSHAYAYKSTHINSITKNTNPK